MNPSAAKQDAIYSPSEDSVAQSEGAELGGVPSFEFAAVASSGVSPTSEFENDEDSGSTGEAFDDYKSAPDSATNSELEEERLETSRDEPCATPGGEEEAETGLVAVARKESADGEADHPGLLERFVGRGPDLPTSDGQNAQFGEGINDSTGPSERGNKLGARTSRHREGQEADIEQVKPCPRCGATCLPPEVEVVFGFRNMRWTSTSGETKEVRRQQSYCRKCRVDHAAELRGPIVYKPGSREQNVKDNKSDPPDEPVDVYVTARAHGIDKSGDVGGIDRTSSDLEQQAGDKNSDDIHGAPTIDLIHDYGCGTESGMGGSTVEPEGVLRNLDDMGDTEVVSESGDGKEYEYRAGADGFSDPRKEFGTTPPPRRPPVYRPPAGGLQAPMKTSPPRTVSQYGDEALDRSQAARVSVRALFQYGGYCTVSLLASRSNRLPEDLRVSSEAGELELVAVQEEWYEMDNLDSLAGFLRTGIVFVNQEAGQEWTLSGRDIYVLASGTEHRGFVSCSGLTLGREHFVLCTAELVPAVEAVLREAGCSGWNPDRRGRRRPSRLDGASSCCT